MERNDFINEMRAAIEKGSLCKVKKLIAEDHDKLNMALPTGSWLNLAVRHQQKDIMEFLLAQGIDKNIPIPSNKGNSINTAARTGNVELIDRLIHSGVKINLALDDSNPVFDAVDNNKIDALKFILEAEKHHMEISDYEKLLSLIKERAEIMQNSNVLSLLGDNGNHECSERNGNFDADKLKKLLCEGIKKCFLKVLEIYDEENIYIISLEADGDSKLFYMYVNTEENLKRKPKKENISEWYCRFCENEWYVFSDSPQYFEEATKYISTINIDIMELYSMIAEAFTSIRKDKFFDKCGSGKIILTVNAYEHCDRNDMIQLFCKMNNKKDCDNYINNIDEFY